MARQAKKEYLLFAIIWGADMWWYRNSIKINSDFLSREQQISAKLGKQTPWRVTGKYSDDP